MNRLKNLAQTDTILPLFDLDATDTSAAHHHSLLPQTSAAILDSPADDARSAGAAGCHALFAPLHYEPKYAYPLLVWLHAAGGSERDLRRVMPKISLRNYVGAALRGIDAPTADGGDAVIGSAACGADEFDFDDRPYFTWRQTEAHVLLAEQRLFSCIEHARRSFHVAGQRVFLAGHGAGGTMALRLAWAYPERFSGVMTIAGALPRGPLPRGGTAPLARVRAARQLPILIAAGQAGVAYSQHDVADDLRLLHSAGMSVSVRLYPGGDELSDLLLADLDRWMMEQICPGSATPTVHECDLS